MLNVMGDGGPLAQRPRGFAPPEGAGCACAFLVAAARFR